MRCPFCRSGDSRVLDSREVGDLIRRRRTCPRCQQRFTTHERLAGPGVVVVKKDGRREPYDREKLLRGFQLACTKRPVAMSDLEAAAEAVEAMVFALGESEIASSRIGELVLAELAKLDPVAYIRFASVYQGFADLESLKRAIEQMSPAHHSPAFAVAGSER